MRPIDLCPMCGMLREMDVSGFTTISVDPAGNRLVLLTKAYHCAACGCFVRSEDVPATEEQFIGVRLDEETVGAGSGLSSALA
jgi:hypothetical protein